MAKENLKNEGGKSLESIESTLSKTELFIENNQKTLLVIVAIVVVLVVGFFGVKKFYLEPRENDAQQAIYHAEQYFENDNFANALNGDGNNLGFADIVSEYGNTKTGNLAKYYAGVCCLKTGDFNKAIEYLKSFKGKDQLVTPLALGNIADAYLELGKVAEAASYYEKAANISKNSFTAPNMLLRAAMTYEMLGNYQKAISLYQQLKSEYPNSNEAFSIEKNIANAETNTL
ncbi:MAG TPA: tetratricopeptide repeat protein [Bacteroidetes bacterium]|nr:tetratricopeptide repeat protein [Candidatus Limimorpha avicola]